MTTRCIRQRDLKNGAAVATDDDLGVQGGVLMQFALVPAVLMSDGSIFANFGYGYEPVIRSCSAVVVSGQTQRIAAGGVTLSQQNAMAYTPPVPNQTTASQQMIANGTRVSGPAQLACFTRDAAGRVFVYRRS